MATVVDATYDADQAVLRLDRRLSLSDRAKVRVSLEPMPQPESLARRLSGSIAIGEKAARHIVENEDLIEVE